jgi:hypothetical protein
MDIQKLLRATPAVNSQKLPPVEAPAQRIPAAGSVDTGDVFAWCLAQHEAHHGGFPAQGGRNAWLAGFALFCNERGAKADDVEAHALTYWQAEDFPASEIQATVRGIYRRHAAQHGSRPYTPPTLRAIGSEARSTSPVSHRAPPAPLPSAVYAHLPAFLQQCCAPFPTPHERDVMLLGTLAVLSGCFPTVSGLYDGHPVGLNLFTFIVAPAASGKGALTWARQLAWPWHEALTTQSKRAQAEHADELAAWQASRKQSKGATPTPAPVPPPYKQLYLPANTTASMLMRALADNEGQGIICETEADTLSGALGADFGNFSDLLRKAFHHESVSLMRKTDREHIDLAHPALSIALTGTPAQLPRLIPTAEDGLFSRFLFYTVHRPAVWRDVSPAGGRGNLAQHYAPFAQQLTRMIEATAGQALTVALSPEGWTQLNTAGAEGLAAAVEESGEGGASTALRLGLIAFRLAGVLTLLRCFDNGEQPAGTLTADEADVTAALGIVQGCRAHALALLATMPQPGGAGSGRFAAKAAQEARAKDLHAQGLSVRAIAEQIGVSKSTVDRWIE